MASVSDTVEQRGNRYGGMEDNAILTQTLMDTVLEAAHESGQELSPVHKECLHMIFHKVSRMAIGDQWYTDNPHDIGGYAKLIETHIEEKLGEVKL